MLKELSGVWHYVYTGVCVKTDDEEILFYDRAEVLFRDLSDKEIDSYIDKYDPLDKAGAYGIQDDTVVETYKGSYFNIVGLPKEKLAKTLAKYGV